MTETLLTVHADFVRARAPQVHYSARILYQELRAASLPEVEIRDLACYEAPCGRPASQEVRPWMQRNWTGSATT